MVRRVDVVILEMLRSIAWIEDDTCGMSREIFQNRRVTQQLVERNIEIISEASRRIPDHMKLAHPLVPWRSIAGIGNVLRHDYHDIRANIIWDIVVSELPALKVALEAILQEPNIGKS